MKLSKFVKRAKSESYCVVIHADDSGIWLGTRLALYNATELPYMEGKEQAGAVLDIDSKAWEKMFFDEKSLAILWPMPPRPSWLCSRPWTWGRHSAKTAWPR